MRMLIAWLALAAGIAYAQEPPPEQSTPAAEQAEPPAAEQPQAAEEQDVPDIDVWSDEAMEEDDVFIPSERIRADSSISFPTDI